MESGARCELTPAVGGLIAGMRGRLERASRTGRAIGGGGLTRARSESAAGLLPEGGRMEILGLVTSRDPGSRAGVDGLNR
mgnify:CR=1 FL=1